MPFIDCKISAKLTDEKKEILKAELGKNIGILHKPESFLMVGIVDNYNLYFASKKLENGAYVGVKLFGSPSSGDCERMTAAICNVLQGQLNIAPSSVYVTYEGISDWGWNGGNF